MFSLLLQHDLFFEVPYVGSLKTTLDKKEEIQNIKRPCHAPLLIPGFANQLASEKYDLDELRRNLLAGCLDVREVLLAQHLGRGLVPRGRGLALAPRRPLHRRLHHRQVRKHVTFFY